MDHGEFETQDGGVILLKKNSQVSCVLFFTCFKIIIGRRLLRTEAAFYMCMVYISCENELT